MNIIRTTVKGQTALGAFALATDKYAIISEGWSDKSITAITKALNVDIIQKNFIDTSLVGIMIAGNSNGLILPHLVSEKEVNFLQEKLGDSINIGIIESKITCLGNCILTNDYGAVVHEQFEPEALIIIEETLDVEVEKGNILNSPLVGSQAIATNRGVLSHPLTTEMELEWLSERFGVKTNVGTINRGIPQVSIGCFANSTGAITGKTTTGPELQRLFQTLKGS
ncbi:MAG: translation initiation factor IF-6 [Asgard group archaeon]|nr:translation initiation factor IF-6 [Asgard group archaeon]